jgi:thiamine biosynthesis lipoprotein
MISGFKKYAFPPFCVLLLLNLLFGCGHAPTPAGEVRIQGFTMGTTYSVKLVPAGPDDSDTVAIPRADIEKILDQVNSRMSIFDPDSEISAFNRYRKTDWFPVSLDTVGVLERSLWMCRESGGAFDVTIAPLVELWGFGINKKTPGRTIDKEITEALQFTGCDQVRVRLDPPALRKNTAAVTCNLSAIAKGFGVDRIAEYLITAGVENFMVEIGGEIRCRGENQQGRYWRIGILAPGEISDIYRTIELKDSAIATSGDYRNYFERDGRRYSHTIDPATGYPIVHRLASVSVLHASCLMADAFATAINVLGPERGMELADEHQLPVLMIIRSGEDFKGLTSARFDNIIKADD